MTGTICSNCDAPLSGPYCSQCGQHAHTSARSIRALAHEALHLLTHVDVRLLRTLGILVARPGKLTLEHFKDRRARYVPPFQLYFIISLALFGLVSIGTHLHPAEPSVDAVREQPSAGGPGLKLDLCDTWVAEPQWLSRGLQDACKRQALDQGASLERHFVASLSKMMFIFLPLMALVMMLLYFRHQRFYVEHLVFFLHLHAAIYVAIIVSLLIDYPARYVPWLGPVSDAVTIALWLYAFWYAHRSMRQFYGQSRARTALKLAALSGIYFVLLCITSLGTLIYSAIVT